MLEIFKWKKRREREREKKVTAFLEREDLPGRTGSYLYVTSHGYTHTQREKKKIHELFRVNTSAAKTSATPT